MTNALAFAEYDARNPHLYQLFSRFAHEARRRGWKHLSAKMIFERIRWETDASADDGDFKINDKFVGHYARKFMEENPEFVGFFRTRVLRVP